MKRFDLIEVKNLVDERVEVCGFLTNKRDHGKILFLDLRDRSGVVQCVIDEKNRFFEIAKQAKVYSVVKITGQVRNRPPNLINPKIETGRVEILIENFEIISTAKILPLEVESDGYEIDEALRLKYRYLDLRRQRLQKNIIQRHKFLLAIRNFLNEKGFIEIETPILTKSTPEGARDYLVPSRIYKGKFYALPQSPQQYKQLLMVAGFEKYFQIARCFRDEDPRADRQPEFTQLDIEMSYIERDEILNFIENLFVEIITKLYPQKHITAIPFPRLTFQEAIENYSSDKPDLRKNKSDPDELAFCFVIDFPMFEWKESERRLDTMHHPFTQPKMPNGSKDKNEIIKTLRSNPESLLSEQYDLVLNGYEIGGGSIRITDPEVLIEVFRVLGHSPEETRQKFGHLLEAFSYGVPPHGGIAPGVDRILMILENEVSIREVIAFPKTGEAQDLMMNAPSEVDKEILKELGLKFEK